jgi:hypothetical protein
MGSKAIVRGGARMLHQQHPICFHPCGPLPHNPVAVRAAHSAPRVAARGMRASPQRVVVAAERPHWGRSRAEHGTAEGGGRRDSGRGRAWSARRLKRCRHWIVPHLLGSEPPPAHPRARRALPRPVSPSPPWIWSHGQGASAPCPWAESSLPSRTSVPSAPRRCAHGCKW